MAVDAKTETSYGRRLSFHFLRTVATDEVIYVARLSIAIK